MSDEHPRNPIPPQQSALSISDGSALLELSAIVNASEDLGFILSNALLSIMGKCLITRAFVLVADEQRIFHLRAQKGLPAGPELQRFELHASWFGVLNIHDLDISDDDDSAAFHAFCLEHGIHAIAPMVLDGAMAGVICVGETLRGGRLSDSDAIFLESAAAVAATAVAHAIVIDRLKATNRTLDRRVQELNTLFELSREMNSLFDEEKILRTLGYALMGQLRITRYIVFTRQERSFDASLVRVQGFRLRKSLVRGISRVDRPVVLDALGQPLPPMFAWLASMGIQVCIPLRSQNRTDGMLCVGERMGGGHCTPDEVDYLGLLASITSSSLANAHLLKETLEKQRMEEELQLARSIQKGLLPTVLCDTAEYGFFGMNESSRQVGGDYYDVIPLSDHELVIAIGDVSGKGIPASLLMANVQAALRTIVPLRLPLAEATARINTIVYGNTGADKFITFFWGVLDTATHRFSYVNAGHNPPYLVRRDGHFHPLTEGGLILGILPTVPPYETGCVDIGPEEFVFMYTDGVNEALSKELEEFGNERMESVLARHRHDGPEVLAEAMKRDIQKFTTGAAQSDDITMLLFRRKGFS